MSITTTQKLNVDQLSSALPAGTSFTSGDIAAFPTTNPKTITAVGTDDATLQTAINTAAASFADYDANLQALLQKASNALAANQTYLGIASPTNAQAVAQIATLTRQVNALIRVVADQLASTAGT